MTKMVVAAKISELSRSRISKCSFDVPSLFMLILQRGYTKIIDIKTDGKLVKNREVSVLDSMQNQFPRRGAENSPEKSRSRSKSESESESDFRYPLYCSLNTILCI
jgi:hypothetical protein